MARNIEEKVIEKKVKNEIVTCDLCGTKINPKTQESMNLVAFGLKKDGTNGPIFESCIEGDYCNECLEKLQNIVVEKLNEVLVNRYDNERNNYPDEKLINVLNEKEPKEFKLRDCPICQGTGKIEKKE